jgi:hypothetical protein
VKLSGQRLELGEVESALLSHADVAAAVVVKKEQSAASNSSGDACLVAYVQPRAAAAAAAELTFVDPSPSDRHAQRLLRASLRESCQQRLPAYMVPRGIVLLEALPLSASLKVDRKALPQPDWSALADEDAHENSPEGLSTSREVQRTNTVGMAIAAADDMPAADSTAGLLRALTSAAASVLSLPRVDPSRSLLDVYGMSSLQLLLTCALQTSMRTPHSISWRSI